MDDFSRWPAPAKLNLFLRIVGRRDDGYHDLQTVYQLLDFADEVELAVSADGRIRREAGATHIPPRDDLAVRAAQLLQAATRCSLGVRIRVHKRIPEGAGLGGGSSDAATVLLALNHLWGCGLERRELARLGLRLGADVPVFVHGRSAWAEGVGERLRPFDLGERHYVLVLPGIHIATSEVFAAPDLVRDAERLIPGDVDPDVVGNAFEPVVLSRYPRLAQIFSDLRKEGRPRLTGTGSCIFIAVEDKLTAEAVTCRLGSRYNVRPVIGIDRSPVLPERSGDC